MTIPIVIDLNFETIDAVEAFMQAGGGNLDSVPKQGFRASLQNWVLPGFEVNHFEATPHTGRWGPPERTTVGEPSICLVSPVRGRGVTRPARGEAYGFQPGDLEIAGHDAAQQFEFIGDVTGITRLTAVYLPAERLRALGAPVAPNRLGLLSASPLRPVIDTYLQAFTIENSLLDSDMLAHNFTELVSFLLRGTLTSGVRDSPGVLYDHYVRALRLIRQQYANPDLNAATAAMALRISERTLFQAFSAQKKSFRQELQHLRLQRAAARLALRLPGEKVATIAFDCGFDSLTTFNRAFKATFDLSPRDWQPDQD